MQIIFMQRSGWIADNVGRKPLMFFGIVGSGVYALMVSLASLVPAMTTRIFLVGLSNAVLAISFSALSTSASTFIGDLSSFKNESQLQSLRLMAIGFGGAIGPLRVGG